MVALTKQDRIDISRDAAKKFLELDPENFIDRTTQMSIIRANVTALKNKKGVTPADIAAADPFADTELFKKGWKNVKVGQGLHPHAAAAIQKLHDGHNDPAHGAIGGKPPPPAAPVQPSPRAVRAERIAAQKRSTRQAPK